MMRSPFAPVLLPAIATLSFSAFAAELPSRPSERPNVLLIAVDDLNDWVGAFGGNPQARTPRIDAWQRRGATAFQRTYCPGPVCGPSRSALLSGFMPHRTGVYNNQQNMRRVPLVQTHATLPEYFAKHGYHTLSSGKIFHKHFGDLPSSSDDGQWAFEEHVRERGEDKVDHARLFSRGEGIVNGEPENSHEFRGGAGAEFEWGPIQGREEDTRDARTAAWAAQRLAEFPSGQPFFMAVGISQPHLPWFLPQKYFDLHPLETIRIPEHKLDDFDDILDAEGKPTDGPSQDYKWVSRDPELFKRAVQAYLAACSYADARVGEVLDALERSPHRDNTIVVIFGDHGWHLGEKLRFRKATLWAEATRLPLLIRMPGQREGSVSPRVVNLIDLYPTLLELCGLPAKPKEALDGRSFAPLLRDPHQAWPHPTLVIDPAGNAAAVIDERHYYIRHDDGSLELYDMEVDPLQWTNLAKSAEPAHVAARERLAKFYPASFAPPAERDPRGAKPGQPDPTLKAKRILSELK